MYSILLSEYEEGMKLVYESLKKIVKSNDKVVIIAWTFPIEIDYERFNNEWLKKGERRYNKYVGPLIKLGLKEENIKLLNCYDNANFSQFKK